MRRRNFIKGGSATVWPLAARAQQREPMRRIGVLMGSTESELEAQARLVAFRGGAPEARVGGGPHHPDRHSLGCTGDTKLMQRFAKELVALRPELVLSSNSPATAAMLQSIELRADEVIE